MKEFNKLLQYRDYYEYDYDCEAIRVSEGDKHEEARALYAHIVRDFFLRNGDKWAFDIALDCIRRFDEKGLNCIMINGEIKDYHFGYGMYVRNNYIHISNIQPYLIADDVSGRVLAFIYTILFPTYNCLSKEFMKLISDFTYEDLKKQFGETHPIINEMYEKLADLSCDLTAKEALDTIINTIRTDLGRDGFKNILLPIVREHVNEHGTIRWEWEALVDKLYNKTCLYKKEFNQFRTLDHIDIVSKISTGSIKTPEEGRDHLVKILGLAEEDALYMAEWSFEIVKVLKAERNKKNEEYSDDD